MLNLRSNKMNLKQTIKVLEEHNRWRRDNNVPAKTKMAEPKVLGMALDRAIEELKNLLIQRASHCTCTPDETTGTTSVKCCNICGKPAEDFWRCG